LAFTEFLEWLSPANSLSIKDIAPNSNLPQRNRGLPSTPWGRGISWRPGCSNAPKSPWTGVRASGTKNQQKTYGNLTPWFL